MRFEADVSAEVALLSANTAQPQPIGIACSSCSSHGLNNSPWSMLLQKSALASGSGVGSSTTDGKDPMMQARLQSAKSSNGMRSFNSNCKLLQSQTTLQRAAR